MTELPSVTSILATTRARKAADAAATESRDAYVSRLSTSLQALVADEQVTQIIEFLGDTRTQVKLSQFRDEDNRGWYLVLTGKGLQKFENGETIPFSGGGKVLAHAPRMLDLSFDDFAARWTDIFGERENPIVQIRTRIVETAEGYAQEMLEQQRRANRPTLLQMLGALIFPKRAAVS